MSYQAPIPRPTPTSAYVSVTLRLADPSDDLLVRQVRLLRDCVALAQARWKFDIDAAVVLPDEMHLLCRFSDSEFGVSGAIRLIKAAFVRHLPVGPTDGRQNIWADTSELIEVSAPVVPLRRAFIEAAPVRAGLVKHASDWPYSSANKATPQASDMGVAVA